MFGYKSTLISIFSILIATTNLVAQVDMTIPNERTYVHTNTTLLFPGDYLYYKCYVQRLDTGRLSDLSKMVYVELINEERELIFNHKLFLDHGEASADFFVDQSIPSGNYKLIAYTHWMKNLGTSVFYKQDISIINPYTNFQKKILKSTMDILSPIIPIPIEKSSSEFLKFSVDKDHYDPRSGVYLSLEALNKDIIMGTYSISVKRRLPSEAPPNIDVKTFTGSSVVLPKEYPISNLSFLPELRGELLEGQVLNRKTQQPIGNTRVALSALGQETLYTITTTNTQGTFYMNIGQPYELESLSLKPLDDSSYSVKIVEKEKNDYSKIDFFSLQIDRSLEDEILNKSVHNQIENAFSQAKPDSVVVKNPTLFFDDENTVTYTLDDYTRFKTFKQTVQEIITHIGVRRVDGNDLFFVRTPENVLFNDVPSIVLLDGLLIDDHTVLSQLDANEIKAVQVFNSNFVNNGVYYKGAFLVETKDMKDANTLNLYSDDLHFSMSAPQKSKKYFAPDYSDFNKKNNAIPDFRYQLLWYPNFVFADKKNGIEFFTSDIEGTFDVTLEGFTQSGKPVSSKTWFTVGN